jgi:predicted nucleic acid-binding protein
VTTAPVIAQASRSPRQVQLRRFLQGCDVVAFAPAQARAVGELLAKSSTADVVDAHLALTAARTGAVVITSDPGDLRALAAHVRPRITIRSTT